jgi:hypothetical protein
VEHAYNFKRTQAATTRYALLAVIAIYAITQVRKPSKWAGRPFLWLMNNSHSNLTDWGCGTFRSKRTLQFWMSVVAVAGRFKSVAAAAAQGKVYGVDYAGGSELSIAGQIW